MLYTFKISKHPAAKIEM